MPTGKMLSAIILKFHILLKVDRCVNQTILWPVKQVGVEVFKRHLYQHCLK